MPEAIGGTEVKHGVYWGGSFEVLQEMIGQQIDVESDIKLFIGYSGWSPGQLEHEMEDGSWLVADASQDILFEPDADKIWQKAIYSLGADYRYLANMPADPSLN